MTDSTSFPSPVAPAAPENTPSETQLAQAGDTIEVSEPKAEWTVIHSIAPGEALQLNFDPTALAGGQIKDGNLELTFDNSGVAVVQGYEAWAAAGGLATGPQGGAVDMAQLLAEAGAAEQAAAQVCAIPGQNVIEVPTPQAGETITITAAPGDVLQLACDMKDVKGTEVGDTMELLFPTGGTVIVDNFDQWAAASGATVADCVCGGVNLAEFIVAIGLNPEDVLPAAPPPDGGPAGPLPDDHNGAAFTPGPGPQLLSGYPYPNILPPTGLNYGVPEPDQTFFPVEEQDDGRPDAVDDPGDDNPPNGGNEDGCVDEEGLVDGGEGGEGGGNPFLLILSGNVLANDDFGPDGAGDPRITDVVYVDDGTFPGTVTRVVGVGIITFTGEFDGNTVWRLTIDTDAPGAGVYTFQLLGPYPHPEGAPEDQIALENFLYTIQDSDGDTDSATLTICIDDDNPTIFQPGNALVEEDNLPFGIDENVGIDTTDTRSLGIDFGADGPGDVTAASLAAPAGLTSAGDAVLTVFDAATNTLTGFVDTNKDGKYVAADDREVFTVEFDPLAGSKGEYTFTLLNQLDHPLNNKDDEEALNLKFNFTVTDGDGDTANGSVIVEVRDDLPAPVGEPINVTVEEDDLNNAQGKGNNEDGSLGKDVATGTLTTLISSGADDPATFGLGTDFSGLVGQGLKSGGDALSYVVVGDTLTGFVDDNANGKADAGEKVFTLQVESDGDFKFTLIDQLDHVDNGLNDENLLNIDFSSVVSATDKDGDELALGKGTFTVTVQDDVPVLTGKQVSVTVEEDDLNNAQGKGNNEDGSVGKDVATGTLTTAVSVGADEPATFAFGTDLSSLVGQGLKSGGDALSYVVVGDTLTGFVDDNANGKADAGEKVFTLQVESDGDFKFTLIDQLDHKDDGKNDENLLNIDFSSVVTATDKDGDEITLDGGEGGFTVTVQDDIPVLTGTKVSVTVEEDDLNNAQGKGNNEDLSVGKDVATGTLTTAVSVGADEPATFAFGADFSGLVGQGLKSGGDALSYVVVGDTLTGFVDDNANGKADAGEKVFTLQVESDGDFKFTLIDQLDHVDNGLNDENLLNIDFSSVVSATDKDGDELALGKGTFTVTVQDDVPVLTGKQVSVTVEEDDLNNAQGKGNNEDGSVGKDVATGTLTAAVSVGADEPATFAFGADLSGLVGQGLKSAGDALSYVVVGDTLTGFVDDNGNKTADAGEKVFTLQVESDGDFKFTLIDQLDHVDNGKNDENLLNIDFSSVVSATDKDGDELALGKGTFTVTVQDDVPVLSGETICVSVEEDDLDNAQGKGNNEDGSSGKTVATGDLDVVVKVGADEPATFGFGKDFSGLVAQGLASAGEALAYAVAGDTLTGFIDTDKDGSVDKGERQVFTLQVEADGDFKFTLIDQLDHVDNGKNDENLLNIDFSSVVSATDKDGDEVALGKGTVIVQVQDDIPVLTGKQVSVTVEEDDLNNAQGKGNNEDGSVGKDVATGTLTTAVSIGADEPGTFAFGKDLSSLVGQGLKSGGDALSYAVTGDTLTGFIDTDKDGVVDKGERQVFTLQVESDGDFKFTLIDQLDHLDNGLNDENLLNIDFSSVVSASDKDGDDLALGKGSFTVTVVDDIPVQNSNKVLGIVEEEALKDGIQELGDPSPDTAVAKGSVASLVDIGADEPGTFGLKVVGTPVDSGFDSGGKNVLITSDGSKLTGFADKDGDGKFDAGELEVFTLTVDKSGNYEFTLKDTLDHPVKGVEDTLSLDLSGFVTATDKDGDEITLDGKSFTIDVVDDIPNAIDDVASVDQQPIINLVIIFDRSGSMDEDPNVPGFSTRIDLERAAVASLLSAYESVANVNVLIVDFAGSADNSGWLTSIDAANAYLAQLEAAGTTNYKAALDEARLNYGIGLPAADQSFVYFLSDGQPNPSSTSLDGTANGDVTVDPALPDNDLAQTQQWEQFLIANGIEKAFAVGIGPDVAGDPEGVESLGEIAFPDGDPNNPIIIGSGEDAIFDALVGTIVPIVAGNVLNGGTGDEFGADGPGSPQVTQFVHNSIIYTPITPVGGTVISNNGVVIVIATMLGGQFEMNFNTGAFQYTPPTSSATGTENFLYTIQDADGDTDSANLSIDLAGIVINQPNRVFGTDGNDTLPGTDPSVTDNGSDVMSGGDGNDSISGAGGDDHISGGAGADTISGGSGNDIILGGTQGELTSGAVRAADLADVIDGGAGDDFIYGGTGSDTVTGGQGNDTISTTNGTDTVRYTSTLDGHDVVLFFDGSATGGQDILDLDALFDSLLVATALRDDRTNIVDKGATVDVQVDADNNGSFELTVATLNTNDTITEGTDVVFGTL